MDLRCLNDIIDRGLAIHIDLTDNSSWNLNTGFTSISLNQWSNAKSDDISLYDFGLTAFDNGRVRHMHDSLTLTPDDTRVSLYRIGYNNASGGTFYNGYGMTGVTSTAYIRGAEYSGITASTSTLGAFVGNHFNLNGGYLQGFYKLYNYNYELLPSRFNNGVTIETLIRIDTNSFSNNGFIFLMGERAEDKYNKFFSGETTQLSPTLVSKLKETIEYLPASNAFSGVTTGEANFLAAYKTGGTMPMAIQNLDNKFVNSFILQPQTSIYGNVIGLLLNKNGTLGYRYVNDNGAVLTRYSENKITRLGWTIISMAFKPYETIDDPEVLECAPRRKGDLTVFVNGREFWKIKNFDEFFFRNVKNQKEKQLGVPFNISWGGGSFGLKHSWHYDFETHELYDGNNQTYINNNFIQKTNPTIDDVCITPVTGTSATTGIQLTANSSVFSTTDECDPDVQIPITVLQIHNVTGLTGATGTTNKYYFEYEPAIELLSNREYNFKLRMYDTGIFNMSEPSSPSAMTNSVRIVVYGDVEVETLSEIAYDGGTPNSWFEVYKRIKLENNTALQSMHVGIEITSSYPLLTGFTLYVEEFSYTGPDKLVQDERKNHLTVESNFSNSFRGGIQKLRVYDFALNSEQALHNAYYESRNNPALNMNIVRGGRLIYGGNGSAPIPNVYSPNTDYHIQLTSSNVVNVNVILPTAIQWTTVEIAENTHYLFSGGTKIYFKVAGIYKLSYNLLVDNAEFGEKVIGVAIRKNGVSNIIPYDSPIYIGNAIGYRGSSNISDYLFNVNVGDFIEMVYYRIGDDGDIVTVPNGVFISVKTV